MHLHSCLRGGKTIHALCLHMSDLNFCTKPSVQDSVEDLNDDAFVLACKNIGGRDIVEEFMSCGVWPLSVGVDFEQVKVDLTPFLQHKVPLPNFPLSHEDGEDDVQLLARVEQEDRNIMGGYTHVEHEAYIASLPNNGRLNHVLEVVGVAYGPRPVPISTKVLKKRKADAATKVSAKRPKVTEKKGAGLTKVSGSRMSGSLKWPSGADIPPAMFAKLSKGTVPRAIASTATAHILPEKRISEVSAGAGGAKGDGRHPGCKIMPGVKAAPSAKKRIVPAIGALAALSLEGTEESSLHDQVPEVQSKADPRGPSVEPQA
jgi:hypothetical protein